MWLLAVVLVLPLVASLTARGPTAVLHLQTAKTSAAHPLHASGEVTLWCAPDNLQITIRRASFLRKRDKKRFEAQLSENKKNATLTFPSATVGDAGEYTCELDTQHGRLTTQIHLYARPVAVADHEHFTVKDNNEFHLEGERRYVRRGDDVNITCPVFGYPTPGIKWAKDGKPLEPMGNGRAHSLKCGAATINSQCTSKFFEFPDIILAIDFMTGPTSPRRWPLLVYKCLANQPAQSCKPWRRSAIDLYQTSVSDAVLFLFLDFSRNLLGVHKNKTTCQH
ncbi:unnamed protein product [Haemonchus placei]|uniref:Ig-like domain-containing protein n=1 Tax=Haemonchus placei TaxID=6290 RepID=A0A0N4WYP2_HAEPC|nr:unnamed protein product [Haemonchus placei]